MGQWSPTCTSPSMREWPRIAGCQQQPFPGDGHAVVCLSDCRRLAPTWKTARRSPLPRSSSANSAGSRRHLTTLITNDWDGWAEQSFIAKSGDEIHLYLLISALKCSVALLAAC